MKIISRYVLKHLFPIFGLALSAFLGLYLVVDFFERVDNMLEKHVSFANTCLYFLYKIPGIASQGIPMCFLLSTLVALGILKRNRELVALRAAGISTMIYTWPIISLAAVVSLIHFGAAETLVRPLNQKAQLIWQQNVQRVKASPSWSHENVWYRGQNVIYQIRMYDKTQQVMNKVSLFYFDSNFKLIQRVDARQLRWMGDGWLAENGIDLRFQGSEAMQEAFDERKLNLSETPRDFASLATLPEDLGYLDLYQYIRKIRLEGYNPIPYSVELHLRVAVPLTTLFLALLGIVISLRQGLHGGIVSGVGVALLIALFYLALLHIGSSMATAGILPVIAGVWAGNILFATATLYLRLTDSD
ncbi:MAG: LPS export ABC transporter permease LptG [Syntrophobacteraceae bacterium]